MGYTLDSFPVVVGDNVYDLAFGQGVVVHVSETTVRVQFASHQQAYRANGVSENFGRKTLYWDEPLSSPPPKDNKLRIVLRNAYKALETAVYQVHSRG